MKNNILIICLIIAFVGSYESNAQTNMLKQKKFMIRHTVVFKFKPSVDSIAAQSFFCSGKKAGNNTRRSKL